MCVAGSGASTDRRADYQRFAESFPRARLHVNVSFVHERRFLTSEGGARSYLVALYLVFAVAVIAEP